MSNSQHINDINDDHPNANEEEKAGSHSLEDAGETFEVFVHFVQL